MVPNSNIGSGFSSLLIVDKGQCSVINKNGTTEKHDLNNNNPTGKYDKIIKNGYDNHFPFHLAETVSRCTLQKRAFIALKAIMNGVMSFTKPNGKAVAESRAKAIKNEYKRIGLIGTRLGPRGRAFNFIESFNDYIAVHGGAFATLSFGSNGRRFELSKVNLSEYSTGRLSAMDVVNGQLCSPTHVFHSNWGYNTDPNRLRCFVDNQEPVSWLEWNKDYKKNKDKPCYVPTFGIGQDISNPVNRMQSMLIANIDCLSGSYPIPSYYSSQSENYMRAGFELSRFDIDDIERGLNGAVVIKVQHQAYLDPTSAEAKVTYETQKQNIINKLAGARNSGAFIVTAVTTDENGVEKPLNGEFSIEDMPSNNKKERHEVLDKRVMQDAIIRNGITIPEMIGIINQRGALNESGDKLVNAIEVYVLQEVMPKLRLLNDFVNYTVHPLLGIKEEFSMLPNIAAFADLPVDLLKWLFHPDQIFEMYKPYGIKSPTESQKQSGLIEAYRKQNTQNNESMSQLQL